MEALVTIAEQLHCFEVGKLASIATLSAIANLVGCVSNRVTHPHHQTNPLHSAFLKVHQKYPFEIDANVLFPDHIHCIWTRPPDDQPSN